MHPVSLISRVSQRFEYFKYGLSPRNLLVVFPLFWLAVTMLGVWHSWRLIRKAICSHHFSYFNSWWRENLWLDLYVISVKRIRVHHNLWEYRSSVTVFWISRVIGVSRWSEKTLADVLSDFSVLLFVKSGVGKVWKELPYLTSLHVSVKALGLRYVNKALVNNICLFTESLLINLNYKTEKLRSPYSLFHACRFLSVHLQ